MHFSGRYENLTVSYYQKYIYHNKTKIYPWFLGGRWTWTQAQNGQDWSPWLSRSSQMNVLRKRRHCTIWLFMFAYILYGKCHSIFFSITEIYRISYFKNNIPRKMFKLNEVVNDDTSKVGKLHTLHSVRCSHREKYMIFFHRKMQFFLIFPMQKWINFFFAMWKTLLI